MRLMITLIVLDLLSIAGVTQWSQHLGSSALALIPVLMTQYSLLFIFGGILLGIHIGRRK